MRRRAKEMAGELLVDRLIDRLSPLGEVTSRPLFGGHGFYWRETIFAILYRGRLYLKVDEDPKGDYHGKGHGAVPTERAADIKVVLRGAAGRLRRPGGVVVLGEGGDPGGPDDNLSVGGRC